MHNVSLLSDNRFKLLQYIQLKSDFTAALKAHTKLNFVPCLSLLSCLLISSAILFSFSCLLFSPQLAVLQVNILSYALFHSRFSHIFSFVLSLHQDLLRRRWGGPFIQAEKKFKSAQNVFPWVFPICSFSKNFSKRQGILYMQPIFSQQYRLDVKWISVCFCSLTLVTLERVFIGRISTHFHGAPALNHTLFELPA